MPGMVKNRFFRDLEKSIIAAAAFLKDGIIPFKII